MIRRWSKEEDAALRDAWESGFDGAVVARDLGRTDMACQTRAKRIKARRPRWWFVKRSSSGGATAANNLPALRERLLANVSPEPMSGCWLWTGCDSGGYGVLSYENKQQYAHRLSYEEFVGPIPDEYWVLHKCDVPACINPDHLFVGDVQANVDDMIEKRRAVHQKSPETVQACGARLNQILDANPERRARGERNGSRTHPESVRRGERAVHTKLTHSDVLAIRASSESHAALAREYGVTRPAIAAIKFRKSWAHV